MPTPIAGRLNRRERAPPCHPGVRGRPPLATRVSVAVAPCSCLDPQPTQQASLVVLSPERGSRPRGEARQETLRINSRTDLQTPRLDAKNATLEPAQHVRSQEVGSALYPLSALNLLSQVELPPAARLRLLPSRLEPYPRHLPSAPGRLWRAHTHTWDRAALAAAPGRNHSSPSPLPQLAGVRIRDMQTAAGKICSGPMSGNVATDVWKCGTDAEN